MEKDTIQTDVSAAEGEKYVSPRERMMASIEERLDGERQGQEVAPQTAATATTDNEGQLVDDPAALRVRVKVDGKEQEIPVAELITGYQKNVVASERLRQASQKQKELEARERRLLEQEQQIQLAGTLSTEDAADDHLEKALSAIAEGDTTTAAEALRKAIDKGRQPTTPIDKAALVTEVKETLASERVWNDFLRDNPEFREEYDTEGKPVPNEKREYGDFLFEKEFAPLVEKGELSYQEALGKTAERVKAAFSPPPAAVPEKTGHEKRQERKKEIDNLPLAAGAVNAGHQEEPEESHTDIIRQMRQSRGLPA